jgi:prepilin-type N-terminal cleavage/methylation domain-containing protein
MKKINTFLKNEDGFSLIEIAIALIVVGLIIGGVLKGKELIENAKLNVVARNVDMYRVAIHLFADTYGSLPGDFHLASSHIHAKLRDGQNDGIIGGHGLNPLDEAANVWVHLAQAGFIGDVGQLPAQGYAKGGQGVPQEKIGGVFTIQHDPYPDMSGHWLLLGRENGPKGDGALLTPQQARALSQKMDSTDPHSGRVRGHHGMNVAPEECIKNGQFNTLNAQPACVLYFQL